MVVNTFGELAAIVLIAIFFASIMRLLKQPLIIGYILTGISISPYFLNLVQSSDSISTFAQIGVALLLFMVGLNLNPKTIKDIGMVALVTGITQVVFTTIVGYFILLWMGFSHIPALYISVGLSFSSTIIIMKLLSDKGDTETLYGRIAIGFLIVQDLIAIIILMMISSATSGTGYLTTAATKTTLLGLGLIILAVIIGSYLLPKFTKFVAQSQEFLLLFSVGWCIVVAAFFYALNFSMEIGALAAGFILSFSPYRWEISSKLKPIRDFFLILFFVILGSQMVLANITNEIWKIAALSLFVMIGNPLIMMIIMGLMGYTKRTSFLTGLTVAQVSEFSLILLALGVKVGHISKEILSMVTIISLITFAGSSYFIIYADKIYPKISKYLSVFERKGRRVDSVAYDGKPYEVILFGYNRIGYDILESFKKIKKKFLVIDYNPDTIHQLQKKGIECVYGDAADQELLDNLDFSKAKMIVSTVRELETDRLLIRKIRQKNPKTIIIAVCHQIDDSLDLYEEGATYVITPHFLGGHHTATMIEEHGLNFDKFIKEKIYHINQLKKRKEAGHEHPVHEKSHN